MSKKIVIIGGGTAGASAAFSARKQDRSVRHGGSAEGMTEITIIDKENYSTYSRCGLPFAIKGVIQPIENLIVFPSRIFTAQKITQKLQTEVLGINHQVREINCRNIVTNEITKLNYDTLIFATGSTPSKPPIAGIDGKNVFTLRTIDDAKNIMQSAKSAKSAVIIGASFIGLEVAEALKHLGLKVTIIEQRYLLWRMLDKEISAIIKQRISDAPTPLRDCCPPASPAFGRASRLVRLWRTCPASQRQRGEEVVPSGTGLPKDACPVRDEGFEVIENKTISDVNEYKDAMVIISTGVRPQVKLAKEIGVAIGSTGGIKVDKYLRTNLPEVYAVGDCAESISELTGEPVVIGLGTIAARQGVVAGANAAGHQETGPLILNASVLKLLDMEIGSAGVTEFGMGNAECGIPNNTLRIKPVSALIKYPSLPHYYPVPSEVSSLDLCSGCRERLSRASSFGSGSDVHIKLIADKETRRIIGGQVLCKNGAAQRVNVISLIIQNTMTVNELLKSDFCYSPPVTDIWEPIIIAAQALIARLNRA